MKKLGILAGVILATVLLGASDGVAQNSRLVTKEGENAAERLAVSTTVVLNEVYGGAGCGTAGCSTYQNDFIELRNISATPVNITGWSVQYASATGTAWQVTPITNAILQPGDRYLIAESFGANGVSPLPTPNLIGTIAMSATAAKVALVNTTTALTGACPTGATIVDLMGYGATASCFEGAAPAPAPSTTTSDQRNAAGLDTDTNSTDFTAVAPTPQRSTNVTAADVIVSGRLVTSGGRGIVNAYVTISGGDLEQPITVRSGRLGQFSFEEIQAGHSYLVTVLARRFTFNPSSRIIDVNDSIADVNFVASSSITSR